MTLARNYTLYLLFLIPASVFIGAYLYSLIEVTWLGIHTLLACSVETQDYICGNPFSRAIARGQVFSFLLPFLALRGLFLFTVALPQIIILALPAALILSSDLQRDAQRSWWFYVITGTVIGGIPWILFNASNFEPQYSFYRIFEISVWAVGVGATSGVVLKWLLLKKLDRTRGIENNIK